MAVRVLKGPPADGINVLGVLVLFCFHQTVSQRDQTLGEALVDGPARDGDGGPKARREQTCGEERTSAEERGRGGGKGSVCGYLYDDPSSA